MVAVVGGWEAEEVAILVDERLLLEAPLGDESAEAAVARAEILALPENAANPVVLISSVRRGDALPPAETVIVAAVACLLVVVADLVLRARAKAAVARDVRPP